jgi:futalosine hydrolase
LAIASEEIFGDEGVITPQGWRSMRYLRLPLLRKGPQNFFNRFPADFTIVRRAKTILKEFHPRVGPFVTVSEVTGTDEKADEMERRFRGICENMEGAPAAQLCTLYGTSFLEIRGISNVVKQRDKKAWNLSAAARVSQEAARVIITRWEENP